MHLNKFNISLGFSFLWICQVSLAVFWLYKHSYELEYSSTLSVVDSGFFTFDSINYRQRAIEFANYYSILSFSDVVEFIEKYGLNYSSIAIAGSLSYGRNGFNDWFILASNSLLLWLSYQALANQIKQHVIEPKLVLLIIACFLYVPYVLIQLNKEIIGIAFVIFLVEPMQREDNLRILIVGLVFGFFRAQYLAMSIALVLFSGKFKYFIVIAVNVAVYLFIPRSLQDWGDRVESMNSVSNTISVMQFIDDIAYIPVFGAIGYLLRIIVVLLIGVISPLRVYLDLKAGIKVDVVYHFSLMLMSGLFIKLLWQCVFIYFKKIPINKLFSSNLFILWIFFSITSIAPFMQPRYYFPVVFIMIINVSSARLAIKNWAKNGLPNV